MSDTRKVPVFDAVEGVIKRPLSVQEKYVTVLVGAAVVFALIVLYSVLLRELWNRVLYPLFPNTITKVPDLWRMLGVIVFVYLFAGAAFGLSRLFMKY